MSGWTLRILAYLTAPLLLVAGAAEAGVGDSSGSALSSFGRLSPAQRIQFSAGQNCYYDDGWNGRGWYQCGDEWNNGFGWIGPLNLNTFGGPAIRRRHRNRAVVLHPRAPNPVYPRLEPPRRPGVGGAHPSAGLRVRAPSFGGRQRFHQLGAGGVHPSTGFHPGPAPVSPGIAGGGLRGFGGGSRFHGFGGAGAFHGGAIAAPHVGARISPDFTGGGFHGSGGIGVPHIGAPASPGFTGGGGFHAGGGIGVLT